MDSTELERLIVRLMGDSTSYQAMLNQAQQQTLQVAGQIEAAGKRIEGIGGSLKTFAMSAVSALLTLSGGLGVFKAVELAATAEQTEIAFGTMLQSAEKGKKLTESLVALANSTPLMLSSVNQAAKVLLQFGVSGENVIPIMRMLGDAAGGDAQRFQGMSLAFGQMSAAGRLMGQDLLQMINAGFNPLQEMSRTTGKSVSDLKKEMEKGNITTNMVIRAFQSATSAGGNFNKMMEKQAQTTSGLFSTLKDTVESALRTIGKDIIETFDLKGIMKEAITWLGMVGEALKLIPPEAKQMAVTVVKITAGVVAATLAVITFKAALSGLSMILSTLYVKQLAGLAVWALWKTVMLGVTAIIGGLNLLVWASAASQMAATAATAAWTVVMGIAKVVTIAWTLALYALQIALGAGVFLAAAAVVMAIAENWDEVTTAVKKVGETISDVFGGVGSFFQETLGPVWEAITSGFGKAFNTVSTIVQFAFTPIRALFDSTFGAAFSLIQDLINIADAMGNAFTAPLNHITGLFGEWSDVIKDVIRAAKVDIPLAINILKAGVEVAVAQIKDLWPPLWAFLRAGWNALTDFISENLRISLVATRESALIEARRLAEIAQKQITKLPWENMEDIEAEINVRAEQGQEVVRDAVKKAKAAAEELARVKLEAARKGFDVQESEEVKAAKERLKELQDMLPEAERKAAIQAEEAGLKIGGALTKSASAEIKKLEGAILGSAEAFARIAEYRDKVFFRPKQQQDEKDKPKKIADLLPMVPDLKKFPGFGAPGANGGANDVEKQQLEVLKNVQGALDKMAGGVQQGVALVAANLGG